MFDAVRNNQRIVQLFLALITLPFAFVGIDSYVRNGGNSSNVAQVGDSHISPQEFQKALLEQQDRLRAQLGAQFKPEMLDAPEARKAILDGLVAQRTLGLETMHLRMGVSDEQLREVIAAIPALQEGGKFSMARYEEALRNQGLTQAGFEARLRQDLTSQQIPLSVRTSSIVSRAALERWIGQQLEQREVAEVALKPEAYSAQVKLAPDAVQKYYDTNKTEFELPQQARVEYVVLSQAALADKAVVSDTDIKAWYDGHPDRYRQGEERRASHILIPVPKDAPAAQAKAAQEKAENILTQVKKNPADFARLAKENSQDPGSAANGGDLGFFARGSMVKAFEESAFSLKENQVSELVRSDFGFHIIKLSTIKAAQVQPLAQVHEAIAAELKAQAASRQYAEAADAFTNLVYEQSDSLKPAADKYKLTLVQGGWVIKGAPISGVLNHPKLLTALFSDDAVQKKRNTEAVEVAPNTLVSARVAEYKPASLRPLAEVQAVLSQKLIRQEAAKLAQKEGEDKLARLQKGEKLELSWGASQSLSRAESKGVPAAAQSGIFKLAADKLPGFAGALADSGAYVIYKVSAVKPVVLDDKDPRVQGLKNQYLGFHAEDELVAYMAALRQRYPVVINKTLLEAKDR